MITLDVYFDDNDLGTACLIENVIADKVQLDLSTKLFVHETKALIEKSVEILKKRYEKVDVNIHWDTLNKEE